MSYPTTPAFVHYGDWSDATRANPCLKWMEDYTTQMFDKRKFDTPYNEWHSDDYVLVKPDGTEITSGGADAWKEVQAIFAPFTAHRHRPIFAVVVETDYGWLMIGQAYVCGNLVGPPASGEKKAKDPDGNEWDLVYPGAYRFEYVKDAQGGIKMRRSEIMTDTWPVASLLLKRGVMKVEGGELQPQQG
jgi:hypothetical protein